MLPTTCLLCIAALLSRGLAAVINLDNIDTSEPTMRVSPDRPAPTLAGVNDYFGWAAIFHSSQVPVQDESISARLAKTRIIVGAPFGTFPGGLGYSNQFDSPVDQSGLVYNCPITSETCEGVRGNTSQYVNNEALSNQEGIEADLGNPEIPSEYIEGRLFDEAPNARVNVIGFNSQIVEYNLDNKHKQLLGSTLYSTGDEFIACAPLYRWDFVPVSAPPQGGTPIGMCYTGQRELENFSLRNPCDDTTAYTDDMNTGEGFCMAGFSAAISNSHYVIGAPGYEGGRGVVRTAPLTGGDFVGEPVSDTLFDQYEGFQTVLAHMTVASDSGMPENVVTSVPKFGAEYRGSLFYYENPSTIASRNSLSCGGTQMAEFFGYSLAAADVNNDLFDEIIVGAPMYTDFSTNRVERGRVYLFINNAGTLMCGDGEAVIIDGPSSLPARARFGSSLTLLGDIDADGLEDFAVGAPYYQASLSSVNTGAVFIYYGRTNFTELANQMPFMITADDMSTSLSGVSLLTFGWSLSSGHDVDANGYNDLLVGAYESQSVFVLRTLPVADVQITFIPHDIVDIDMQASFDLEIEASFSGTGVSNSLTVDFELREIVIGGSNRVFFTSGMSGTVGRGQFVFTAQGTPVRTSVTVYTIQDISDFTNYTFNITLLQITRNVAPVTGDQPITPLDDFPKIRQGGETTTMVAVQNFCGTDGCISDVFFGSITPMDLPVVANSPELGRLVMVIENSGAPETEPALNLVIEMTNIPVYVTGVSAENNALTCDVIVSNSTTCQLADQRINMGESATVTALFTYNSGTLIGNEDPTTMGLRLVIPNTNKNQDSNLSNNGGSVTFEPTARADLAVRLTFTPNPAEYTGEPPMNLNTVGVSAFDLEVVLQVDVNNMGPSTIQSGNLVILLPSANPVITSPRTFLYPYDIRSDAVFQCTTDGIDPDGFLNINTGRRRRSARARAEMRNSLSSDGNRRAKRQANTANFDLDCNPGSESRGNCTMFTCSITNMRSEQLSVRVVTALDERYFSTLSEDERRMFRLRAWAQATITNTYIIDGNNTNNMDSGDLVIQEQMIIVQEPENLLHAILWPVLGGVLLLIALIIILYFCGFFRRKRKGGVDIEGVDDFPEEQAKVPPRDSTVKEPFDIKDD